MTCRLKDLPVGASARIVGFSGEDRAYRARLLSMGLTRGTVITVQNVAPMGDPLHIAVRDFELALRRDEAAVLELEPLESECRCAGGPFGLGRRRGHRCGHARHA